MGIKPALFTVAAALAVGLSGCGASTDTSGTGSAPLPAPQTTPQTAPPAASPSATTPMKATQPATVSIKNFEYTVAGPVAPGAKVTVTNLDDQTHTVTSAQAGIFDVKINGGGATSTFDAPKKPGTYRFLCTFHAQMKGALVVR